MMKSGSGKHAARENEPVSGEETLLVQSLMTPSPATVTPEDHLNVAASRLWDQDCGALPVIDGSSVVVGVLTDRDICMATWSRATTPELIPVKDAMSMKLVSCRADDTIDEALAAMRSNQVRRLPVVDDEQRLVGMLSLADIVQSAHLRQDDAEALGRAVVSTLGVICQRPVLIPGGADRPSLL